MAKTRDCFIIMPITTPKDYIEIYKDEDHFKHVLTELFIPAISKAGFNPIPPITVGSEIIQAEIIKNLDNAEMVLVDMSILNPNVFFELGIRTALNKPTSLVIDNGSEKIPFDTHMINCHTYNNNLAAWIVKDEIIKLTKHLEECAKKSKDQNALWKYFGLSSVAKPIAEGNDEASKIELINLKLDALRRDITYKPTVKKESDFDFINRPVVKAYPIEGEIIKRISNIPKLPTISEIENHINPLLKEYKLDNTVYEIKISRNEIIIGFQGDIPDAFRKDIDDKLQYLRIPIIIMTSGNPSSSSTATTTTD
jgi:nucleoside 2-deoxyribosyltransferase